MIPPEARRGGKSHAPGHGCAPPRGLPLAMPPGQPEEPMSEQRGDGAPEPWERVEVRQLAEYDMFGVREDHSRSPRDGRIHTFHVAESPGGVVVIALTEAGQVV